MKSFPPDSSGGIDGLRPQHLKDMFLTTTDTSTLLLNLSPLENFCSLIFNGNLPEYIRPFFFGARLIALRKKDGGIRPIAIGNSIRRLLSKIACQMVTKKMSSHLSPYQTGFGIQNGAESAIHATRSYIEEKPDRAFLKIDFKNAFNCVHRDVFLSEVRSRCPEIFPYVSSGYEVDSVLLYNTRVIPSQEGVQQGDPIGPMLFCAAIHSIIQKVSCELNIWYLDDGIIGDTLENVLRNFEMIVEESKKIGLDVNISKCEVFAGKQCQTQEFTRKELTILTPNQLYLLGSSLNPATTKEAVEKKFHELEVIFSKLSILPCHYALHVLKNCFSTPKLIYLLRTAPCFKEDMLTKIDSLIQRTIRELGNINITGTALDQAMLPCRLGGLGIRNASDLAVPAYLSSVISSHTLATALNPSYRHSVYFEEGLQIWQATTEKEWPTDVNKQKSWDEELVKIKHENILRSETDVYHQKRLQCLKDKNASYWLNALPSKNIGTFLNDQEIRPALCLRLGLPFAEEHKCACGVTVDRLGRHCFSCKRNPGKVIRHNTVNKIISQNLIAVGLPNTLEPSNLFGANGLRPDGVSLVPYKRGKSMTWDFTCPHPLCTSHLSRTNVNESAETKKEERYAALSENYLFIPIAIDTLGRYGSQAEKLINEIGAKLAEKHNDPRRTAFLKQNIGIAIQRGNAKTLLFSLY
jgi:hypothetical protein